MMQLSTRTVSSPWRRCSNGWRWARNKYVRWWEIKQVQGIQWICLCHLLVIREGPLWVPVWDQGGKLVEIWEKCSRQRKQRVQRPWGGSVCGGLRNSKEACVPGLEWAMVRVMEIIWDEYSGVRSCRRPHCCGFESKLETERGEFWRKEGHFLSVLAN